ncbi:MAG: oxidoreductase [Burkholderiales bacterium]|nr:oxidoreductase [Burkholderiales bacterium]
MNAPSSLRLRVARKTVEAEGICGFELVDPAGAALPAFSAGSHLDVQLPNGLTRQYSLCNDPGDSHRYQIAVLRDAASRGGSAAMHDQVHEGQVIEVSAPRNHFPLAHGARRSLLLAGGIGITPLLCMAERLHRIGADFEVHYCTRSPARTAFRERIAASAFAARVAFHYDDGAPGQKLDIAALVAAAADPGTHLSVCGPCGFMDAVLGAARAAGWPSERLHYEFFAAAPAAPGTTNESFEVQLASSGKLVRVAPEQSIVQALAEAGVVVPTSCEQGVCGTCLTRVIEGQPDHRDSYFTPEEQAAGDQMLPCCSRALSSRLVLDL